MPRRRPFDRTEFIEENLLRTWTESKGRNVWYINTHGYNVAVTPADDRERFWKWRLKRKGEEPEYGPSARHTTAGAAKRAALERLADVLQTEDREPTTRPVTRRGTIRYCEQCETELQEDDLGATFRYCGECNAGWAEANSPD